MPNGMYGGVRGERKSPLLDWWTWKGGKFFDRKSTLIFVQYTKTEGG